MVIKRKKIPINKINYINLRKIIERLRIEKSNELYDYVINLFDEYNSFLQKNCQNVNKVIDNLKSNLNTKFINCTKNINLIKKSNIILSSSHETTYYILKNLNNYKDKKVLVICFDMHSDTYDYNDKLWKGNVARCHVAADNDMFIFDNINSAKISDIWKNNEKLLKFKSINPDNLHGVCGNCLAKNSCGSTRKITVFPNGEVFLCQALKKVDINKMGTLDSDFIYNSKWELWRKRNKFNNEECLDCEAVASCGGVYWLI